MLCRVGRIEQSTRDQLTSLWGHHFERTHHFVVLVFKDVTVPDIASDEAFKRNNDARNHVGLGAHSVFPSSFAGLGRRSRAKIAHQRLFIAVREGIKTLPVKDLKSN